MKKILSAVMAAAVVASMGVSIFAADFTGSFDSGTIKETNVNVAKNGSDVQPDKTIYFHLEQLTVGSSQITTRQALLLNDEDYFKVKFKKDEGAKYIKSIKLVEATRKNTMNTTGTGSREVVVEVKLNDDYTDNDYKLAFTATFTNKKEEVVGTGTTIGSTVFKVGDKIELSSGNFWMSNIVRDGDQDMNAGDGGIVIKPTKNDDNEMTWEDSNHTLAKLTFTADSDVIKFFPKLSTKWDNNDYAEYFADQNAFIFSFVSNPTISSTSRALLELYNPYYDDEDDTLTVDPADVIIYEVKDGELVDVTANFTATTNDDGDDVFTMKTRTLGTYIFAEKEAGVEDTTAPDDVPTTDDGKVIPNTGL